VCLLKHKNNNKIYYKKRGEEEKQNELKKSPENRILGI